MITLCFTPLDEAYRVAGRLAALCGDEAEEVNSGYNTSNYGNGAVRPTRVRTLLRAD